MYKFPIAHRNNICTRLSDSRTEYGYFLYKDVSLESVHFFSFGIDDWIIVIFISIYHLVRILQIRYINPELN